MICSCQNDVTVYISYTRAVLHTSNAQKPSKYFDCGFACKRLEHDLLEWRVFRLWERLSCSGIDHQDVKACSSSLADANDDVMWWRILMQLNCKSSTCLTLGDPPTNNNNILRLKVSESVTTRVGEVQLIRQVYQWILHVPAKSYKSKLKCVSPKRKK